MKSDMGPHWAYIIVIVNVLCLLEHASAQGPKKAIKRMREEADTQNILAPETLKLIQSIKSKDVSTTQLLERMTPAVLGGQDDEGWTPLMVALKYAPEFVLPILRKMNPQDLGKKTNNYLEIRAQYLKNPKETEYNGMTALMLALLESPEFILPILEKMPSEQLMLANFRGRTPLMLATLYRPEQVENILKKIPLESLSEELNREDFCLRFMKETDAVVKTKEKFRCEGGTTALMLAMEHSPRAVLPLLERMGLGQISHKNLRGDSALSFALKSHSEMTREIMSRMDLKEIRQTQVRGTPLLHFLVENWPEMFKEILPVLLKADDFSQVNEEGKTVLMLAATYQPELVEALLPLMNHQQMILQNRIGSTALMYAAEKGPGAVAPLLAQLSPQEIGMHNKQSWTALMYAAKHNPVVIEAILEKMRPEDIDKQNDKMLMALHLAAANHPEGVGPIVRKMKDEDVGKVDMYGMTALSLVIEVQSPSRLQAVKEMLQKMKRKEINLKDFSAHTTALMKIIELVDNDSVRELATMFLEKMWPEDVLIQDADGETVLDYAAKFHPEIYATLYAHLHSDLLDDLGVPEKDEIVVNEFLKGLSTILSSYNELTDQDRKLIYQGAFKEIIARFGEEIPSAVTADAIAMFAMLNDVTIPDEVKKKFRPIQEKEIVIPQLEKLVVASFTRERDVSAMDCVNGEDSKLQEQLPCLNCGTLAHQVLSTCASGTLCDSCMEDYASDVKGGQFSAMEFLCPANHLPTPADYQRLQKGMRLSEMETLKLRRYELTRRLSVLPDFKFCKGTNCFNGINWKEGDKTGFNCILCEKMLCLLCGMDHSGLNSADCNLYKVGDDAFQAMLHDPHSNLRPCPFCLSATEKSEACDHMDCQQCKNKWDWRLGKKWGSVHYSKNDGSEPRTYRVPGDLADPATGGTYKEYKEGVISVLPTVPSVLPGPTNWEEYVHEENEHGHDDEDEDEDM